MKAIGFNAGQRGDLIMNLAACRSFKELYPGAHLTFGLGQPFGDMEPLFREHPLIDAVHVWDSYNEWPNATDRQFLQQSRFDMVFNAMPQHSRPDWFAHYYQPEEVCYMHRLPRPSDLRCQLVRWFELLPEYHNYISIALFAGNHSNLKAMDYDRQNALVEFINRRGFQVLQLGAPTEPQLPGAYQARTSYFNSVRLMLSTRFTIVGDTGLSWVAAAYRHPVIGLYGHCYYPYPSTRNYQPLNPLATYLEARHCNELDQNTIFEMIDYYIQTYPVA